MVITAIIEASVATGRLTDYFTAPELQEDAVLRSETVSYGEESIRIRDASFTWNKDERRNVLHDINFSASRGELSCIVGRVGAGKSSMLQTMLGDLYKLKGEVVMRGAAAYVAQSPWVMNASVRENIVFGHRCKSYQTAGQKGVSISQDPGKARHLVRPAAWYSD